MFARLSDHRVLCSSILLLGMMLLGLYWCRRGIEFGLPYLPENDEVYFVWPAARLAAGQGASQRSFHHPGSTSITALALMFRLWDGIEKLRGLIPAESAFLDRFYKNPEVYYLWARFFSVFYFLCALPLLYSLGRKLFDWRVACLATWLFLLNPSLIRHVKTARTDGALVFYTVLALCAMVDACRHPSRRNKILMGIAFGFAAATKYYMLTLWAAYLLYNALFLRWKNAGHGEHPARGSLVVTLATFFGFLLVCPSFISDFNTAFIHLKLELSPHHLGADGFSFGGNLRWYLAQALPEMLTWPTFALAAAGMILFFKNRREEYQRISCFLLVFLVTISLHGKHFGRWAITVVPILVLCASHFIFQFPAWTARRGPIPRVLGLLLVFGIIALSSAKSIQQISRMNKIHSRNGPRVLSREWVLSHLPSGARIAQEAYGPAIPKSSFYSWGPQESDLAFDRIEFHVLEVYRLGDHPIQSYVCGGYRYLIASPWIYGRFFSEERRYESEVAFYRTLFDRAKRIYHAGGQVEIYELPESLKCHRLASASYHN